MLKRFLVAKKSSLIEEPKKNEQKTSHPKSTAKSRIWGTETPELIVTKFCMLGSVQDAITPANFCEDRSVKGFWCCEGSNFGLFH